MFAEARSYNLSAVQRKATQLSSILDNDIENDISLRPGVVHLHIECLEHILEAIRHDGQTLENKIAKQVQSLLLFILPVDASSKLPTMDMLTEIKASIYKQNLPAAFYYVIVECCKIILMSGVNISREALALTERKLDSILNEMC